MLKNEITLLEGFRLSRALYLQDVSSTSLKPSSLLFPFILASLDL
jgi:hypothetical protein